MYLHSPCCTVEIRCINQGDSSASQPVCRLRCGHRQQNSRGRRVHNVILCFNPSDDLVRSAIPSVLSPFRGCDVDCRTHHRCKQPTPCRTRRQARNLCTAAAFVAFVAVCDRARETFMPFETRHATQACWRIETGMFMSPMIDRCSPPQVGGAEAEPWRTEVDC